MNPNLKIHCLKDLDEISHFAFDIFPEVHNASKNRFYIIPGGEIPKPFLNFLSKKVDDWRTTQFILSDEKIINDNQISNEYMVNEILIEKIDKDEKPILLKYNRIGNQLRVEQIIKNKTPELIILGLGSDGHTASLFPWNAEILNDNETICLKVKNLWEDYDRVSLSFSYLMKSNQIIFLASGESKAEALEECLVGNYNPIQYPAQFILQNYTKDIHVLCDQSAARHLA